MANVFSRMLPPAFLEHINTGCDWWRKAMELVHERELDVAMRGGYLNFYRYGQSIAKITWNSRAKKPTARIHRKYLGESSGSYKSRGPQELFLQEEVLSSVLRSAEHYVSAEKKGCHHIAVNHATCVIDLEVGLPGLPSRFDIVAAIPSDADTHYLTFFEAKHSENTCLRSHENPTVLAQLAKYTCDLQEQKRHLLLGYVKAAEIAKSIEIRSGCLHTLSTLIPENLQVEVQPRLVVFKPEQDNNSPRRPLEEHWQELLLKNNVQLIYAEEAKDIVLR